MYRICLMACTTAIVACSCSEKKEISKKNNVLLIVVDDMGFSDTQAFGGEINTPNINRLADNGVRFTRFHTSSLSAPTRSMLLTGVDNHQNGLGIMPSFHSENQYMQPGYDGYLNNNVMTIAETLKQNNYYTCMAGKWHLGSRKGYMPNDRGFENSFSMLGGGACHFSNFFALSKGEAPTTFYVDNGEIVEKLPDDFYSSNYYTDKILEYIDNCPEDKPFFAYLAYTAPHDPLQVPEEWADKYKGRYNGGYDSLRISRFNRIKEIGIVPADMPYPELTGDNPTWDSLSDEQRQEQSRKMEIYASMIECVDYNIGRLLDKLEKDGKLDNTIVIFMSDNGANPKEPYNYPESSKEYVAKNFNNKLDNYGNPTSFISQGAAWAEVSNTPYTRYKKTTNEGGICTPLIVYSKNFISDSHLDTTTLLHVTDIFPTIMELTGTTRPDTFNNIKLAPIYGTSFVANLNRPGTTNNRTLCFEMCEDKAVIKGEWKAVLLAKPYGDNKTWKLYNIKNDLAEKHDLSKENPEVLKELVDEWNAYAKSVSYIKNNGHRTSHRIGSEAFYEFDKKNILKEYNQN